MTFSRFARSASGCNLSERPARGRRTRAERSVNRSRLRIAHDRSLVECIRLPSGRGGCNSGQSRSRSDLLVRARRRQEDLDADALLSARQLCLQFVFRNWVFFLFRGDGLRRLGGDDFRAVPALAMEGAAGRAGSCSLLCRRSGCWGRAGALGGCSARAAEAPSKVDHPALLLRHLVAEHRGTSQSVRNSTAVAVRPACDRRRSADRTGVGSRPVGP